MNFFVKIFKSFQNRIKALFKKYGWKAAVGIFFYYLIRDVTLYIVIPYLLAKGFFENIFS
jgi:hypothetical protein|tara:strand:- start:1605 stop:1784 length:180 start_codon:yes stop_codon:yes gene_type:complete